LRVVDRRVFSTNYEWRVICFSRAERSRQADNDMAAAGRRRKNAQARITRPYQNGKAGRRSENRLGHLIVGQDEAIHQIVRAYQTHVAGLSPVGRPIGNFLFLGPTGSGKTRIVEATAKSLLQNSRAVIKIDCAEFQHSHEIAKLIGSPPGYLGHRETHALLSL